MEIKNNANDESSSEIDISLYRVLLDNSSDPIFCFDRTGKYLYMIPVQKGVFFFLHFPLKKINWDYHPFN